MESSRRADALEYRRSSLMDKARSKLGRQPSDSVSIASSEDDFQKQKAKAIEKQRRKEEYERLGLGDRTKYGMGGSGGFYNA